MFSKLMLLSLGASRTGGLRYPAPMLNARSLEDISLEAGSMPDQGNGKGHRLGLFRRWRQAIASPVGADEAIFHP